MKKMRAGLLSPLCEHPERRHYVSVNRKMSSYQTGSLLSLILPFQTVVPELPSWRAPMCRSDSTEPPLQVPDSATPSLLSPRHFVSFGVSWTTGKGERVLSYLKWAVSPEDSQKESVGLTLFHQALWPYPALSLHVLGNPSCNNKWRCCSSILLLWYLRLRGMSSQFMFPNLQNWTQTLAAFQCLDSQDR